MTQAESILTDTLEFVVRGSDGNVKESRFIANRGGITYEFIGNSRYNTFLNEGKQPFKIPFLNGTWHIVRNK
jgi:hypothetical protein